MTRRISSFKYLFSFSAYFFAFFSFTYTGLLAYSVIIYAYVFIPLVELVLKPDEENLTIAEEQLIKDDPIYDFYLYLMTLVQYITLGYFLYSICDFNNSFAFKSELTAIDIVGRILSMGTLCAQSINLGHELGHRTRKIEQFMGKLALLVSLIMHFFIEHNRGHHKRVATPHDHASAKKGDVLYLFWIRSMFLSYFSAWNLEAFRLKRKKQAIISIHNEMIQFTIVQISFVLTIYWIFGLFATFAFIAAAILGMLILETINYIEHYGLRRRKNKYDQFERVLPIHSWNSNHIIGRLMLFELSRHSDHHYMASRKYQILKHHENAPQMPTGYPGMMVLSLFPPLWFYVMNPRVDLVMSANNSKTS